ncbi:hypothetical protein Tco_0481141 [Tanacetum coccineum]
MKKIASQWDMKRKGKSALSEAKSTKKLDWNGNYKINDFKGMSYNEIRSIFEKVWDFNQHIEPMDMEHGSEKMNVSEKEFERKKMLDTQKEMKEVVKESGAKRKKSLPRKRRTVKRQKLEEDAVKEELKGFLDIVPREDVAEDVESLSTKLVKKGYSASRLKDYAFDALGRSATLLSLMMREENMEDKHEYNVISGVYMIFEMSNFIAISGKTNELEVWICVGIKSLLDAVRITTAQVYVITALMKLNKESTRRIVPVETSTSTALVSCDGLGGYDWSDQVEEGPNYALMAYSSSNSNSESGLESVEEKLEVYKANESIYSPDIKVLKFEIECKDIAIRELRKKLEIAQKEKDGIQFNVDKFKNASKSLNKLIESQIVDNCKKGLGYNAVPPPYTGNFMPLTPDLSFTGLDEFVNKPVVENRKSDEEVSKIVRKSNDSPIIKDWVSDSEEENVSQTKTEKKIVKPSIAKIEFVKPKQQEKTARKTVKQVEKHRQNTHSPRGNQRNWNNMMSQRLGSNFEMFNKACYVCGSFDHLQVDCNYHHKQFQKQRMVKPVWNNAQRVNHQNFAKKTHPCAKKNMVPRAVLMKSGLVSINTARQVNAAHTKTTVNAARPMPKAIVNAARPKAVVNAVKGNNVNAVKASACWVWKPKTKVLDHVSKHNSASITLKKAIHKWIYRIKEGRWIVDAKAHVQGNIGPGLSTSKGRGFDGEELVVGLWEGGIGNKEGINQRLWYTLETGCGVIVVDSLELEMKWWGGGMCGDLNVGGGSKQRLARKRSSKKQWVHKESVSKQGRKFAKGEPSVQRDPLFDEIPEDTLDHMETENAQDVGRTRDIVGEEKENDENILSTEDVLSTDKEKVSTDRPIVSTDGSKVSTDRQIEGTDEQIESTDEQRKGTEEQIESTDEQRKGTEDHTEEGSATQATQTPTSTIFGDDETIAKVLLNMSQAKAVSREKEKGVELKDIEETDRPRPTSTRSLLILKHLPKIDPKDKGKKKIEEEDESESKSDGIPEAEKKFKQLASDEEMARKIQEEREGEEERNRLAEEKDTNEALIRNYDDIKARIKADRLLAEKVQEEEREQFTIEERAKFLHDTIAAQRKFLAQQRSEAIRSIPPTKNQLRNQMMTYLKHIKRSDEDFISIGSAEDERLIKKINEKGIDSSKNEMIKEESKEEVKEESKEEESNRKRKLGTRKKMKSRKRRFIQNTSDDDSEKENDELRLYLTIAPDEEKEVDYEILDRKYPIKEWKTECLGIKPHIDKAEHVEEINQNVVIRSNGQKRYFSTLMRVLSIFDRDDLNVVYQLVMDRYQDEIPEGFDRVLWGDLMIMFNPDDEDKFWNSQQDWNIVSWKLHGSSGVHTLVTEAGLVIHMLVEKKYPLRKKVLLQMLELKLESEEDSTMALELIRFVKKQVAELEP